MKAFQSRWLKPRRNQATGATHNQRACTAAQALVGRILQRYRLRSQPARGLGMEYLYANRLSGLPQALRMSLLLTQRLENAARPPLEMRQPVSAAAPTSPAAPPGSPALVLRTAPSPPGAARIQMTYLQTLNRLQTVSHQRLELAPSAVVPRLAAQASAAAAALPLDRPVSLVTRPAPAGSEAASRAAAEQAAPHQPTPADRQAGSAQAVERAAAGLPPAELRRVTEQVIQEIDRRIIANRERFGRT